MHNAAKSIEQRIEGLGGEIKALENVSAIRFKQSKAFELHNPYPIIGEEGNRNFGDNVLFKKSLLPNSYRGGKCGTNWRKWYWKTTLIEMILNHEDGISISPPKAEVG